MGRRKQCRPHRSGGIIQEAATTEGDLSNDTLDTRNKEKVGISHRFVEVDPSVWTSDEHFDIAEVIVSDSRSRERKLSNGFTADCNWNTKFSFRFRLCNVEEYGDRIRIGHWPVISSDDIFLEVLDTSMVEDKETGSLVFSGSFDGPDEAISGLVHLVSQKMLMVRPIEEVKFIEDVLTIRVRVEILKNAFEACESLLENTRQVWKRSMVNVMAWLRPEVTTQEAIYGINAVETMGVITDVGSGGDGSIPRKRARFDAATFYEAIKPSKEEPELTDELLGLLPKLRPYQRRAAYWMVQREKGDYSASGDMSHNQFLRPLCLPIDFLHSHSKMFYNPFSGNVSLHPETSSSYVGGGILADEMGLGKTVELLACIFAHHRPTSEGCSMFDLMQDAEGQKDNTKRMKRERVECICGAVTECPKYKGIWVQCDVCDAWQHADCVGFSGAGKSLVLNTENHKRNQCVKPQNHLEKNNIVEMDGSHICQMCLEMIQASHSPVATGATLIVCPSPILHQWHAEIIRHTRAGYLRTCVYEGVRNASLSDKPYMDISELVGADIVLTTYDVLKEDLSHDSDRHEGDRRIMRFQKRYPVIPTLLTRVSWWRVCLDEAQMVESNTAAATEMAMRLHAKHRWCITGTPIQRRFDDLFGLLRFLNASPFDVHRWWIEVIRDPYERRDAGAMEFTHKFFKQFMWRSSKANVADELQLPPQEEFVSWLLFSSVEAHFYQRQHETCGSYAREVIETFKKDVHKRKFQDSEEYDPSSDIILTHAEASKLMHSLLKLRQACCHPQVGSSGLRSMQHSPMTMEEILGVLIGKTKIEGEEALRKTVVALNGLAGIAIIEQDLTRAVSRYREAVTLTQEYSDDFRLDPLLNLHIHHNLADILPDTFGFSHKKQSTGGPFPENPEEKALKFCENNDFDQRAVKRQKISTEGSSDIIFNGDKDMEYDAQPQVSPRSLNDGSLRTMCENIKQKYLSVFISKLSLAQQEFRNSYTQVCNAFVIQKGQHTNWWLEALHNIEQDQESSNELMRKVGDAISGTFNGSRSSRIASRFRSISGLKYLIQTGLDSLESSRQVLLEQLLEVDKTMEKPRDEDILRVRNCQKCQVNADGPACVMCELDGLFQVYETRLFRLTKQGKGGGAMIASAEEAIDLQKKKSALNRFYLDLSRRDKGSSSSVMGNEDDNKQRNVRDRVMVSRSPSELDVVLGVLKNHCKARIGKDGMLAATDQLHLFEAMRKEYALARSLAIAQAQTLNAHDEIKMATSRLRIRENNDDTSLDALNTEELVTANVQFSNDKFASSLLLSQIKGQLRYLKGLVNSKQKSQSESSTSDINVHKDNSATTSNTKEQGKADDEACPVCHDSLSNQKMVFQCGHVTCCRCLVAITEQRSLTHGKFKEKRVMCPTCRQHTDFDNIAYADDSQNRSCDSSMPHGFQGFAKPEASINVQGSYGTKIGAVTRRILWIKSTDPKAKVLVFSSWNDVLDVLEHALSANSISYIRMKGGRKSHLAIAQFKGQNDGIEGTHEGRDKQPETKSFQVLLILIQHGANGLNLLEAQHVILIEPLLNPAAEAQAINRVHRIGQDKKTLVHRFIVKETVEESIFKLNRSKTSNSVISGNTKNQDQAVLTLKDIESLFSSASPAVPVEHEDIKSENLMHLPPAVAAVLAAERRLKESSA